MSSLAEKFEENQEKDKISQNLAKYQECFELFHSLRPSFQKILIYLFNIFQSSWIERGSLSIIVGIGAKGKKGRGHKAWGIMKETRLGSTTIKKFNKVLKGFDFFKIERTQRNDGTKKDHKNRYFMSFGFFKAMFLMKISGCLKSKSYRQLFITESLYNEQFMIELLTDHLKKCPASGKKVSRMYHVFNSILEDLVQYPEPYSFQRKIEKDIEEGNVIIFNWGRHKIPIDEKKKMINTNPAENIKKAIEQADWYARKGNYIQNPTGFFINALSKQRI